MKYGDTLLDTAEEAISTHLQHGTATIPDPADAPGELATPGASFVTLERAGALLGCIGSIEPRRALIVDVAHNADAAAFRDPRLPELTHDDYEELTTKVSVLSSLERLEVSKRDDLTSHVRPGVDGLFIEAKSKRATFLPSVWAQTPEPQQFLDALWAKAGIKLGTWPTSLSVWRYQTDEVSRTRGTTPS